LLRVAVIGAGQGGYRVLTVLSRLPEVEVVGVVDRNDEAPGLMLARDLGIPTGGDIGLVLRQPNLDLVIEVTGSSALQEKMQQELPDGCHFLDAAAARLLVSVATAQEALDMQLKETAAQVVAAARDIGASLVTWEEKAAEVRTQAEELAAASEQAAASAEGTAEILGLIRNLARQTNILGLNASIEAARAGESGRGFGVVAAEVRKLAAESDEAVKKVSAALAELQSFLDNVRVTMEKTSSVNQEQASLAAAISTVLASLSAAGARLESLNKLGR
jgi:hypothetical protein